MSTTIHVVATNFKGQHGKTSWFWDREEANRVFSDTVETIGDTTEVTQYYIDVQEAIDEFIADAIENGTAEKVNHSYPEQDEAEVWGELEFRPDGEFYIERTKASTSEYWPYRVEVYGDPHAGKWRVIDATMDAPIAIIRPGTQNEAFKVTVNGYSKEQPFINLKAAVIYAATEYGKR